MQILYDYTKLKLCNGRSQLITAISNAHVCSGADVQLLQSRALCSRYKRFVETTRGLDETPGASVYGLERLFCRASTSGAAAAVGRTSGAPPAADEEQSPR